MTSRVLVVDDEQVVLGSVRKALRKDDLEIETVLTAEAALELLANQSFDLIITDLMMPVLDGLGLIDRVRELGLESQTIVITGYPTIKTALHAKRLGVFEYVTKPFTRQELRSVVVRALRRKECTKQAPPPRPREKPTYCISCHSWVRVDANNTVTIGMAEEFACTAGDVVEIKMPAPGSFVECGRVCLILVEASGVAHDLHSPVSGVVLEINRAVSQTLSLAIQNPEGEGWLLRLEPYDLEREIQDLVPVESTASPSPIS